MATKKTEVAVATQAAMTAFSQDVPDYIKQGGARGSEEVKSSDMVLPRLEIVQASSPIKDVVEDIKEGWLFNSVTQESLGDLAYFVPVYYRMEWLVWKDQDEGGGFMGSFSTEGEARERMETAIQDDPKLAGKTEKGRDIVAVIDTPVHYGLLVDPADPSKMEQIVISMPKTKAKVSRKWNAMIQIAGGDRFSRVYKISTFKDENNKGQKFFNFVIQPAGFAPKAIYEEAERVYEVIKTQNVRAAHESAIDAEGGDAPEGRGEI